LASKCWLAFQPDETFPANNYFYSCWVGMAHLGKPTMRSV
jgi:hypothetical protein